ncbi:M24 family metallopeptidase [Lachnospiraceae bacterium ZAX-1]
MSFTSLTVLCHGRTIGDDLLFPDSDFIARRAKVNDIMTEKGLDGIIAYTDTLTRGNVCYLTNFHNFLGWASSILVLAKGKEPIVLATIAPRDLEFTRAIVPKFVEIIPVGLSLKSNEHISVKTIEYLKEKGILDKKWGFINTAAMPSMVLEPWTTAFPNGLTDVTEEYGALRTFKSDSEIYAISQASSMAKKAVFEYLRQAKPGVNESVLAAKIDRQVRINGADAVSLLTYGGKGDETMLRVPWERNFEEGDTVSAFANVQLQRYNGAFGTTAVIGAKTADQEKLFEAANVLFNKKIEKMVATHKTVIGYQEDVCKEGNHYNTVVNGVGIDLVEYPMAYGTEADLKPGMTITLSLNVYKKGVGSVFMSQNLLIGKEGIVLMSGLGKQ